jgi:hypothetical protein
MSGREIQIKLIEPLEAKGSARAMVIGAKLCEEIIVHDPYELTGRADTLGFAKWDEQDKRWVVTGIECFD